MAVFEMAAHRCYISVWAACTADSVARVGIFNHIGDIPGSCGDERIFDV